MAAAKLTLAPAFIGRDEQLAVVRRCLAESVAGTGSLVVVSAEAGLGKSRLLEEAALIAAERGTQVLSGAGVERAEKLPNGLFAGVLADFLESATDAETEAVRELVAELMPHLWSAVFPQGPMLEVESSDMQPSLRQSLFLARVIALLVERSRHQPVLICLDDLHWADSASLRALQPLAQQVANAPLTVLATLRPEEQADSHTQILPSTLLTLQRLEYYHALELQPLSAEQVRAATVSCFRREALSVELFDLLHERSGGVPLFLIQYLDYLLERGVIHQQQDVWVSRRLDESDIPDTVRTAIRRRIDQLAEDERDLLSLAAVQGSYFEGGLLAKALAQPLASTLRDVAELGRRTRLVKVDGRGFRFSHAVLTESFYQLLPESKRRHIHLRLAHIIERDSPEKSDLLAYHFYRGSSYERALPHLVQSARNARNSSALREARLYLSQAQHAGGVGAEERPKDFTVQLLQAEVEYLLGEYDTGLGICRQLLEQAAGDAAITASACLQMAQIRMRLADWDESRHLYRRAQELFSDLGDDRGCAKSQIGLGNIAFEHSDLDAAQAHFTDARQVAFAGGDDGILGSILGNLGVVATVRGQYVEAVLHYTEALKAHTSTKNLLGFCQTFHNLGMCQAHQEDWQNAINSYNKGLQTATRLGALAVMADIRISCAMAQLRQGDLDGAETASLQAAALMAQLNNRLGLAECQKVDGMVLRERGDFAEGRKRLQAGRNTFGELGNELGVAECEFELGVLEQQRGENAEARTRLLESVRLFREIGAENDVRRSEALLAEVA